MVHDFFNYDTAYTQYCEVSVNFSVRFRTLGGTIRRACKTHISPMISILYLQLSFDRPLTRYIKILTIISTCLRPFAAILQLCCLKGAVLRDINTDTEKINMNVSFPGLGRHHMMQHIMSVVTALLLAWA